MKSLNPLLDAAIDINHSPDGAPHIHTHHGVSVQSQHQKCTFVLMSKSLQKCVRLLPTGSQSFLNDGIIFHNHDKMKITRLKTIGDYFEYNFGFTATLNQFF